MDAYEKRMKIIFYDNCTDIVRVLLIKDNKYSTMINVSPGKYYKHNARSTHKPVLISPTSHRLPNYMWYHPIANLEGCVKTKCS